MAQTDSGIIRTFKKRHNFVIIDKTALEDARLSYKARGMLAYLLSKPSNWTTNTQNLINQSEKDGREAVLNGLKELEACGYLLRKKYKDKAGRFRWEVMIFETLGDREEWEATLSIAEDSPTKNGFPGDGKTGDGKPDCIVINQNPINTNLLINENTQYSASREVRVSNPEVVADPGEEEDVNQGADKLADPVLPDPSKPVVRRRNPLVANKSSSLDQGSATFEKPEQLKDKVIDDIEELPLNPDGTRRFPWNKRGSARHCLKFA
ncbi:MAG: hypothetical protein KME22_11435 [Hassallia sp. WJT32-NPBG1]|jgi:hypothetical protein|nr:hypothetical protein [Hassallia sp. WJT32-NPBG1]